MKKLYFNGFLIQGLYEDEWSQNYGNYIGTGRYVSWPLEWKDDDFSKKITDEANQRWFYYFYYGEDAIDGESITQTINDLEYLNRYINHCKDLDINIRILQIQTTRNFPIGNNNDLIEGKVLGYDYVSCSSFTSLFAEDISAENDEELIEIRQFDEKLNINGMLDNLEDIEKYVSVREKLIQGGVNLEQLDAVLIMRVADVTENFIKTKYNKQ